jgi:branched-chain amino acid transport system ATP-binding protein
MEPGEIVAVIGPNGSGKSTLLKSILGFVKLFQGKVSYCGKEITGVSSDRIVGLGIGYVPQVNNVFPNLTISENLDMGAYQVRGRASIKASMEEMFSLFPELALRKRSLAGNMSGGERQMLAVARTLMARPRVIFLDEPLASLSPKIASTILSKLQEIAMEGDAESLFKEESAKQRYLGLQAKAIDK